jgi:flagellar biosynthesis anti-sigma factor FlgM
MTVNLPNSTSSTNQADLNDPVRSVGSGTVAPGTQNAQAASESPSTKVTLSNTGVQALQSQLTTVPDIRQERVSALQKAVANGTYNPSGKQIADAIHEDLFGAPSNT